MLICDVSYKLMRNDEWLSYVWVFYFIAMWMMWITTVLTSLMYVDIYVDIYVDMSMFYCE